MKLGKTLCSMFLFAFAFFGPDCAQNTVGHDLCPRN